MDRQNYEWRVALRNILRNVAPSTVKAWCKLAGINGSATKTLTAYAEGLTASQTAEACCMEVRAMSHVRLRALKQLRSFLVANPSECPKFVHLLSNDLPADFGPMP